MNVDKLLAWFLQPTVVKVMAALAALALARTVAGLVNRAVSPRVSDTTSRYRVRKVISFAGYAIGLTTILVIFSDRLGGLTVAFGVAGAGVAFALQEVIASVAGWVAIMFGGFYRIGDRVQLGGIKGDVIDIGVIRTTLMEIGEWVKGDLYSGRIVRIANSFVFKEPVFNYSGDFPFLWDEASDGRVAMASATFHLVQAPTLDVRVLSPLGPRAVATEKA
jgi:small-conductance mechanosensitive channel